MAKMDDDIKNVLDKVSLNIRLFRESQGMSRERFCEQLGVTPEYFSTIERESTNRVINLPLLLKICTVYQVDLSYFFEGMTAHDEDNAKEIEEVYKLLKTCNKKQLTVIHRFISEVAEFI